MRNYTFDPEDLKEQLAAARKTGHTRLFALAFDYESVMWRSAKDEKQMQEILDSRDESESIMFNASVAVVVVNPNDSDETIHSIIAARTCRQGTGPGYFLEAF